MSSQVIALKDRTVLSLRGADTRTFLQGLITHDVETVAEGRWLYAGLLTPQGKYLHDFFLTQRGDEVLMDAPAAQADALFRKLMLYRLRSKVEIVKTDHGVTAHLGETTTFVDPRLPSMGDRRLDGSGADDQNAYHTHRLKLGVPDGPLDFLQDKTLWLETNADALNGVDFNKGCYVGQELTARMRYRGTVRRRLIPVRVDGEVAHGNPILLGERAVGDVRSSLDGHAIANLRVEDLEKTLTLDDGRAVTPWLPDWLETQLEKGGPRGKEKEAV